MFDFEYQIKMLPNNPGVYIMKSTTGEVIYVGKAKILKNRVKQYFQSSKNHSEKVKAMVKNIVEFEYIVTDSEMEALILECSLIKKYRPKYNILLKDDKFYPFIKVTVNDDFPRVLITRMIAKDGAKYFGPFTDVSAVYETVDLIKKVFPLRTCKYNLKEDGEKMRPCLNYQIGLCKAPCAGCINKADYNELVQDILDLLSGKDRGVIKVLKEQMQQSSEKMNFEIAASLRDKIYAVQNLLQKQKIMNNSVEDEDYIAIYSDVIDSCAQIFFVREGKISGREHFILDGTAGEESGEILSGFIKSFYGGTAFVPKNIFAQAATDTILIEQWLSMKRGSKVSLKIPQKGEKKDLINLVENNARMTLEQFKIKFKQDKEIAKVNLEELAEMLSLDSIPHRIEAYDISNIQGVDSVGSMIVFEEGKAKNSDYRRFKINSVKGANDYESMREILSRRFQHGLDEIKAVQDRKMIFSSGKFSVFPDLIMMDGGKGQINVALEVLRSLNIDIPVCGMVKDDKHDTRGLIYRNEELTINQNSNMMKLIIRMQDEVHRFAITYHRSLRDKRVLHSILEDIPGIGEKRRKELLKRFGSVEKIKKSTYEELLETNAIDIKAAENIVDYFKNRDD